MKQPARGAVLCALALAVVAVAARARSTAAAEEPERLALSDFEIHQYVGSRGFAPVSVMQLDSNGEILLACRQPCSRAELAAMGVDALESQIVLLRAMRLLRLEGDRLRTVIPFLDAAATGQLRAATRELAPVVAAAVRDDVEAMGRALTAAGFPDHNYSVLFSYVLDGMAWQLLEQDGEVGARRLSATSPHWAGEVWGTRPPRRFAAGTSSILAGELAIKLTRPPQAGGPLDEALRGWRDLRDLLRRHAGDESTPPAAAAGERLASWGLVDAAGELAVPILVEEPGHEIFDRARRIATTVTATALEQLDLERLARDLGLRGRQQALVVAYHELMWDLMDILEAEGLAPRPRILVDPAAATPADVAAVALVVDRRGGEVRGEEEGEADDEDR